MVCFVLVTVMEKKSKKGRFPSRPQEGNLTHILDFSLFVRLTSCFFFALNNKHLTQVLFFVAFVA